MSDKNFKVKSGLQVPGVTSANLLVTDSSGLVSAGTTLPIANGGTGQTTATNAINALLPLQTSNDNYFLQTSGISPQWSKVFYQAIKDNGTTVTPRGYLNIVGGTFSDDSLNDITTLTIPTNYVSLNGGSTITASTASVIPLIVKGAVAQNVDLQQWQDSSGTVKAYVRRYGQFISGDFTTAQLSITGQFTTNPVAIIRGAASQTADLQQWQDSSGNIQAKITKDGVIVSGTSSGSASGIQTGSASFTGVSWNGISNPAGATTIPSLVVKGITSQTADLQQWRNSADTVLVRLQSDGTISSNTSIYAPFYQPAGGGGSYLSMTSGSPVTAITLSASVVPFIVKAAASQTANVFEVQNSGGSAHIYVDAYGRFVAQSSGLTVKTGYSSGVGLLVDGYASQTADLQQWRNSAGTVLASLSASGNLMVQDLTVNGTTTTINSTTLTVDDKNIELASVSSPTDTTADGAGITIKGATDKTFNWVQSTAAFTSSEPISAPAFKSAGTAVSSNITLVSGYRYFVDTTAARTLTLPASPSLGDEIQIYDASNSALTNNITVASNSNKIQGSVQDLIIDSNAATVYLTYTGSTYGWAVN